MAFFFYCISEQQQQQLGGWDHTRQREMIRNKRNKVQLNCSKTADRTRSMLLPQRSLVLFVLLSRNSRRKREPRFYFLSLRTF